MAAVAAMLGYGKISNMENIALLDMKIPTKFQCDRSEGSKVTLILNILQKSKMAAMAAILDFSKIGKVENIAHLGMKTTTKLQCDRSKGSKVTWS
jgi:hypothetical protein